MIGKLIIFLSLWQYQGKQYQGKNHESFSQRIHTKRQQTGKDCRHLRW